MGNGINTRFWEYWWIGSKPFAKSQWRLYNACFDKNISVAAGMVSILEELFAGDSWMLWGSIIDDCEDVVLNDQRDTARWMLTTSGNSQSNLFIRKWYWTSLKAPPKIKVFLWPMARNSIPTKDSLLRRGWIGSKACTFCGQDGSVDHLFFSCSIAGLLSWVYCSALWILLPL